MNLVLQNISISGGIRIQAEVPSTDTYFNLTTMLLPENSTNNGTNSVFSDSSTNNFTVTRFGNTTQGTFSPFSQTGWGAYFDGNGDYLTSTAPDLSGTWTVEFWWYPTTLSTQQTMVSFNSGGVSGINIWSNPSGQLVVDNGVVPQAAFTTRSFVNNSWNHVAIVRDGSTTTGYINGVVAGTNSFTPSTTSTISIGRYNSSPFYYVTGYISNLRVVNGTAVYTGAFTPPTSPLTAIAGTNLLTLQSSRFVDNSASPVTLTVFGNTAIEAFSPFNPTAAYSAATVGGSAYFDGNGDYLTIADNAALDMGSSNFTIEGWYFPLGNATGSTAIFSKRADGSEINGILLYYGSTGLTPQLLIDIGGSWAVVITSSIAFLANSWNHFAVVRNGSTFTLYINGASGGSATNAGTVRDNDRAFAIGAMGANGAGAISACYMSGFRVVKGTAVYTAAFTPPTAPLTAIANTSLLCNFTNGQIIDATAKNNLESSGTAKISTTQSKFGSGSIYLDGSGSLISIDNPYFNFGTGDFTIETWIYLNSFVDGKVIITKGWPTIFAPFLFYTDTVANRIAFYASSNGSSWNIADNLTIISSPSTGQWYHIAVTRSGNTIRTFNNGTLTANATSSSSLFSTTQPVTIGAGSTNVNQLNAYIDNLRITTGYARYTSNFTVPASSFSVM